MPKNGNLFQTQIVPNQRSNNTDAPKFGDFVSQTDKIFKKKPKSITIKDTLRAKQTTTNMGVRVPTPFDNSSQIKKRLAEILVPGRNVIQTFNGRNGLTRTIGIVPNVSNFNTQISIDAPVISGRTITNGLNVLDQAARDKANIPGTVAAPPINPIIKIGSPIQSTIAERIAGIPSRATGAVIVATAAPASCGSFRSADGSSYLFDHTHVITAGFVFFGVLATVNLSLYFYNKWINK